MESPDYTDITQIIEVHDAVEVNAHLRRGWRLLSVRTARLADDHQETVYVLGLPRSAQLSSVTTIGDSSTASASAQGSLPASEARSVQREDTTPSQSRVVASERSPKTTRSSNRAAGSHRSSELPTTPQPARPITLVTRIRLPESATAKRRRHKEQPPTPPREPTEEELREQAVWQQVQETGKPLLFEDKLLIPEGMSAWDAIEFLPDGVREQTREAMQHNVSEAYFGAVKHMRETLLEKAGDDGAKERYRSFSYPAQMALAETIVRKQLEMPEIPMRELLERYGGRIRDDQDETASV